VIYHFLPVEHVLLLSARRKTINRGRAEAGPYRDGTISLGRAIIGSHNMMKRVGTNSFVEIVY